MARRRAVAQRTADLIRQIAWLTLAAAERLRTGDVLPRGYASELERLAAKLKAITGEGDLDHLGQKGADLMSSAEVKAGNAQGLCEVASRAAVPAPPLLIDQLDAYARGLHDAAIGLLDTSGWVGERESFESWAAKATQAARAAHAVGPLPFDP